MGCGDDITLLIAYFAEEIEPITSDTSEPVSIAEAPVESEATEDEQSE